MSATEFSYWLAYLHEYPPEEGDTRRAAAIMATITNMSGRSLPQGKHVKVDDFMGGPKAQSSEEQKAIFMSLTGGRKDG
jgi:hypothetical protein